MDYTVIEVPDMNDSVSRISLQGSQYQLRFTSCDTQSSKDSNENKECL